MTADAGPLPNLPPRDPHSHKGTFGRVLVIGGSRGMSGAAALAGKSALRGGAGLVQVAVPQEVLPIVAGFEPSYLTAALPQDDDGRIAGEARPQLEPLLEAATVAAIGPGLGRSPALVALVRWLYHTFPRPLVVDADALNALAEGPDVLGRPGGVRVLTPHPGEFRRLAPAAPHDRAEACRSAAELAARWGVVLVLKGYRTWITDGVRSAENATGNPGLATGGTGDVLTGLMAAFLAQGLAPLEAARLACHVHGLAGDLAAAELGQTALIASDLLRFLPSAVRSAEAPSSR